MCPEMCVLQVRVMQVARAALQDEFDQLVSELEESQSSVAGLEGQVRQEGEKREGELTRCAGVIRDLQQQLEAAEERWNTTKLEVLGLHHDDVIEIISLAQSADKLSEVEQLAVEQERLGEAVRERDRIITQLQQDTACSLDQQHKETLREV